MMSIKIERALRKSRIGDYPSSAGAMLDAVPDTVVAALSSDQLAALLDALWHSCQLSKTIARREAIETGGVWCARRHAFLELRSE
jgi:hypothetical protein